MGPRLVLGTYGQLRNGQLKEFVLKAGPKWFGVRKSKEQASNMHKMQRIWGLCT